VGCGYWGPNLARNLAEVNDFDLRGLCDRDPEPLRSLGRRHPDVKTYRDYDQMLGDPSIEAVVITTPPETHYPLAMRALQAGKHVLVEKPAALNASEIDEVIDAARAAGVLVRVGFNHRYHPALRKARELFDEGALGPMMYVRARYGHGGRPGYENEWRANPELSGGGELIDQGVHVIDLARWFLGDFTSVEGFAHTYFWPMTVDDNAFLLLRAAGKQTAMLHVSCTEWKNLFSFEIYGRDAKLHIEGLGGSYGIERLSYYRMTPEMGPPDTTIWEYPAADRSWGRELSEFLDDIRLNRQPAASLHDAQAALRIVEAIYRHRAPVEHTHPVTREL
jgi:predicted dehydrogenase